MAAAASAGQGHAGDRVAVDQTEGGEFRASEGGDAAVGLVGVAGGDGQRLGVDGHGAVDVVEIVLIIRSAGAGTGEGTAGNRERSAGAAGGSSVQVKGIIAIGKAAVAGGNDRVRIAVCDGGAGGGYIQDHLVRDGVGAIHIVDDVVRARVAAGADDRVGTDRSGCTSIPNRSEP